MGLEGASAIVTGGASELGGATAEVLAAQGTRVTIFDLDEDAGQAHATKIGGKFVNMNVVDDVSIANGIAEAETAHGVARVLINCAGITIALKTVGREAQLHPLDQFRKVIEINLIGPFTVISKFTARLTEAETIGEERGVIINTASIAAFEGQVRQAAYSASKGGIMSITPPIARDLALTNKRVSAEDAAVLGLVTCVIEDEALGAEVGGTDGGDTGARSHPQSPAFKLQHEPGGADGARGPRHYRFRARCRRPREHRRLSWQEQTRFSI